MYVYIPLYIGTMTSIILYQFISQPIPNYVILPSFHTFLLSYIIILSLRLIIFSIRHFNIEVKSIIYLPIQFCLFITLFWYYRMKIHHWIAPMPTEGLLVSVYVLWELLTNYHVSGKLSIVSWEQKITSSTGGHTKRLD